MRDFRYEVRQDVLVLFGSCTTFYGKQCAQNEVRKEVPGVKIQNEIERKED